MLIEKKSILTGEVRIKEIDVTEEQFKAWQEGGLIQNVMPHLSASDREFLITGITDEEWDEEFGEDD